jgi:BMFP domain-containing protein YqiC
MQSENTLFADLSKFLNGAAGTLAGVGREAEASARTRAREFLGGLDFVSRDEFEAVKAMAAAARDEADALRVRLDKLEHPAPAAEPSAIPTADDMPAAAAPLLTPAPTIDEVDG